MTFDAECETYTVSIHCCITSARWYIDSIWGDAVWQYLLWRSEFMLQGFYDLQKMPKILSNQKYYVHSKAMLKYSARLKYLIYVYLGMQPGT